jgi:glycosyltransferase involved in cell wall biosynthesis
VRVVKTVTIDARDAFAGDLRGWGRYARSLVEALSTLHTESFGLQVLSGGGRGPEVLFEQVGLPRALRRRGSALVHSPNCFLPLRRPCPGVVTVHDLAFETHPGDFSARTGAKYRFFTPRAVRSAERVVCVSRFTADDVVARYGVDEAKVRVVYSAPALPVGRSPVAPGPPYVLAVGDLRAKKNLRRLVAAWRLLRAEGLEHRLVLAGADAGEADTLRALAGGEPLELTGYVGDARLDALMRGADALAHVSLYEGFGLVVVEAMARGVPVVAARATALPEAGGDAAVYVDPLDEASIAGGLRAALGRRDELAALGRARAGELSWRRTAEATAAVYGELL